MVQSIHSYIEQNDDSQVKHWLQNCTDIEEVDSKGRTPLFVAIECNLPKIAKLLIKKGCNPNCTESTTKTALQLAIESQNFKLCEMLLANRADPNREKNQFCLLTAIELQNMKLIELLINCRADVNKETLTGISPISTTCDQKESLNQSKMMQLLLKGGAKVNALNSQGYSPLHQACLNGSATLAQLLIKSNGKCDQLTTNGETALHCAVRSGKEEVVQLLLRNTTKINVRSKSGQTPMELAVNKLAHLKPIIEEARLQKIPWKETKTEGKSPIPRSGHSASVYNNRWYIYGGANDLIDPVTIFDDILFFNGDTLEWRFLNPSVSKEGRPPELYLHSSVIISGKLYIFGGKDLTKIYNDLWVLDLEIMSWSYLKPEGPYVIRPRYGHTVSKISDTKFVIFGGCCGNDYFNDIHVFDTETRIWQRISSPTIESAPSKRYLHTATFVNNSIYIYGGKSADQYFDDVFILEIDSWEWFLAEIRGTVPLARAGHAAVLINQSAILVYGGLIDDSETEASIYTFDLDTFTWIKYDCTSSNLKQPLHRAGHSFQILGSSLFAYGGNATFIIHELLPHVLETQALPIPVETVHEKKQQVKPPIPEKPLGLLSDSRELDREDQLQKLVKNLVRLIKEQDNPPYAAEHPIMKICNQIDTILAAPNLAKRNSSSASLGGDDRPPTLPAKPKKGSFISGLTASAPSSTGVGTKSQPIPPSKPQNLNQNFAQSGPETSKGVVPARENLIRKPPSQLGNQLAQPRLVISQLKTQLEVRSSGYINPPLPSSFDKPVSSSSDSSLTKSSSDVPRPQIPPKPRPRGATESSARDLDARRKQIASIRPPKGTTIKELPSLMLKNSEEFKEGEGEEDESKKLQYLAHTQPTQYILPPMPANLMDYYNSIIARIPQRKQIPIESRDFKDKREKQVAEIMNELISTEEVYLHDLAILIGLYKKPLENEYIGCIPPHYLEIIFSNTESLLEINLQLFTELLKVEAGIQSVGLSFMKIINLLPQYNTYCTNQRHSIETVQKLQKTNQPFVDFTTLIQAMGQCARQDIHSFLIKPFQRVTRYPLILKELLKVTTKGKDYNLLTDSIARIDAIVLEANEAKRTIDSAIKMIEIQNYFAWQGDEGQLKFTPDTKYIIDAPFKEVDKTQKTSKRHFFLFNDMMVIAKDLGKKFKKLDVIPLDSCIIWDIKPGSPELPKSEKYAFSVVRTTKGSEYGKLIMCAKSKMDKENWVAAINSAVSSYLL